MKYLLDRTIVLSLIRIKAIDVTDTSHISKEINVVKTVKKYKNWVAMYRDVTGY